MTNRFKKYYQENQLFLESEKILLTVSGGKDSMVMLSLFMEGGLSFGVAHCNFQLRGDDANKDQTFVEEFCQLYSIPFYTVNFETQEFADEKGISIQMAARDLRYSWFEKIRVKHQYNYIATAHHKNDVAETMLINLANGTGIAGLKGISNKKGKIIRPLLCFNRNDVESFVTNHKVPYREDDSNKDTKYTRNLIRHQLLPTLEKINPAIIETLNSEAFHFLGDEQIIADKVSSEKERLFIKNRNGFKIEIDALKGLSSLKSYLYYFLREYNFNSADVDDLVNGLDGQSGKKYTSSSHQIIKDRSFLFLNELEMFKEDIVTINGIEEIPFNTEVINDVAGLTIKKLKNLAYLDVDKIEFPLTLRLWQNGDSFQPLGMNGKKKISDFLIDNKISILDKQRIKVLESKGEIIWLVGERINDRYKITSKTKKALILSA